MTQTRTNNARQTGRAKNADKGILTSFQKIEALMKSDKTESFDVLTGTFQTQKTVFFPVFQLITSVAAKAEVINKDTSTLKGKDLNDAKITRNVRILNEIASGKDVTYTTKDGETIIAPSDINILKRFRENLQKIVSFLVLDLTDSQTTKLIVLGAKETIKRRALATSQASTFTGFKKGYSVKIAVGKMTEKGITEKAKAIRADFEADKLNLLGLKEKQVNQLDALVSGNDDLSLVTFCKTFDVKAIKDKA